MPTPAKICGLTRAEDAEAAVRLGAAYLGVVFAEGPRRVEPEAAREVVAAAGGQVPVFGVFSSTSGDEILRAREAAGLSGAQLHGGGDAALVARLQREGLAVMVACRLAAPSELDALDSAARLGVRVVVEPRVAGRLGGAGVALPTELARLARGRLAVGRMVLAGGLTPENVADAVRTVGPDAVDVSSGVEQIPGIKDHTRLARFLEAVKWA